MKVEGLRPSNLMQREKDEGKVLDLIIKRIIMRNQRITKGHRYAILMEANFFRLYSIHKVNACCLCAVHSIRSSK